MTVILQVHFLIFMTSHYSHKQNTLQQGHHLTILLILCLEAHLLLKLCSSFITNTVTVMYCITIDRHFLTCMKQNIYRSTASCTKFTLNGQIDCIYKNSQLQKIYIFVYVKALPRVLYEKIKHGRTLFSYSTSKAMF